MYQVQDLHLSSNLLNLFAVVDIHFGVYDINDTENWEFYTLINISLPLKFRPSFLFAVFLFPQEQSSFIIAILFLLLSNNK